MVGVDDRLYLKSYTPIIPLRYFTGKTIIYKILGEIVGCGFTTYMHIVEKNDLTVINKNYKKMISGCMIFEFTDNPLPLSCPAN